MRRLAAFILAVFLVASARPSLGGWRYEIGKPFPYSAWSVCHDGSAWYIGSYRGGGWIARSTDGREWEPHWLRLPVDPSTHESVSLFIPGEGHLNILTEDAAGPEVFVWWLEEERLERLARFGGGMMYALGGPAAASRGWAGISTGLRRNIGGRLIRWDADLNRWTYWTPEARESNGHPLLIWDATRFRGEVLAGCGLGLQGYFQEWAGRLMRLADDRWLPVPIPAMGSVVRLTRVSSDPDALYLSTAWGELWRTTDLQHFTRWQRAAYGVGIGGGHDLVLFDLGGWRVSVSAKGIIFLERQEVLRIPEMEFLAVAPAEVNGRWILAGPGRFSDGRTRPVRIVWEE
jgi:hypothetical protein